jgi:hypothetical protein
MAMEMAMEMVTERAMETVMGRVSVAPRFARRQEQEVGAGERRRQ